MTLTPANAGLGPDEERRLAAIVWTALRDARGRIVSPASLRDQGDEVVANQQRAIEARNRLAEGNLCLVRVVAEKHVGRGVDFADLEQHGFIGLVDAAESYDPETFGTRFSTHAIQHIKKTVRLAIKNESSMVRVPVYIRDAVDVLHREIDPRDPKAMGRRAWAESMRPDYLAFAEAAMSWRSGEVIAPSGDSLLAEVAESEAPDDPDLELLPRLLECLDAREREVIRRRFGFGHAERETLRSIGESMGVTRERARQIESAAMAKMRHAADATNQCRRPEPAPSITPMKSPEPTGQKRRRGVHFDTYKGLYRARLYHEGKNYSGGYHETREEAWLAYDRIALKVRGVRAILNFPDSPTPTERRRAAGGSR